MNVTALTNEIHWKTNTNSTTFPDADILIGLNLHTAQIVMDIIRVAVDVDATEEEATTDLIANAIEGQTGYNGEYSFPDDLLRPTRAEITYDGITSVPCKIYDLTENDSSEYKTEALTASFSKEQPYVRFDRGSYIIRPIPEVNVTKGFHIWYEARQSAMAEGEDKPMFISDYHELLAFMGAERRAEKFPDIYNPLWTSRRQELKMNMLEFYKNRYKRRLVMKPKYESFK